MDIFGILLRLYCYCCFLNILPIYKSDIFLILNFIRSYFVLFSYKLINMNRTVYKSYEK